MTQPASATDATSRPRPLDARLARFLVRPLRGSEVRPTHLTLLRAVLGLIACALIATGNFVLANVGAFTFVLANFVDHADGELARVTGAYSRFGHWLDVTSDLVIHALLFIALGYGATSASATWPAWLGVFVGVLVAVVFFIHMVMESELGPSSARLPALAWFEIEDVLYLFPLVTLLDIDLLFLIVAAVCTPIFAIWLGRRFVVARRAPA